MILPLVRVTGLADHLADQGKQGDHQYLGGEELSGLVRDECEGGDEEDLQKLQQGVEGASGQPSDRKNTREIDETATNTRPVRVAAAPACTAR
jgi:hypothetical protein